MGIARARHDGASGGAGASGDARLRVTFAVVGRDEGTLLANALRQALDAARPGDAVWFVDSASSDGSDRVARDLGVEVVGAPPGKGAAIAAAAARCETPYTCLVDADIEWSERCIPGELRRALEAEPADLIVGEYRWQGRRFWGLTYAYWRPLAAALFPELLEVPRQPFSGFRIVATDLLRMPLPQGFGVEVHLTVSCSLLGRTLRAVEVGGYEGPVRANPALGVEATAAGLDLAERHGRLEPAMRPKWERWAEDVLAVLAEQPLDEEPSPAYLERYAELIRRPAPPTRVGGDPTPPPDTEVRWRV